MKAYKVEIFQMTDPQPIGQETPPINVYHTVINSFTYVGDYFNKQNNVISVPDSDEIKIMQIIRIASVTDIKEEYKGIINAVDREKGMAKITYTDFIHTFLIQSVAFDTKKQHSGTSLEAYLTQLINNNIIVSFFNWGAGAVIAGATTQEVTDWGFNLKPDVEGYSRCAIAYDRLFKRAADEYNVFSVEKFDPQSAYIVNTGKNKQAPEIIETNAPYVIRSLVRIEDNQNAVNVLTVYDSHDPTGARAITFFLNRDGTITETAPTDRMQPPIYAESIANYGDEDTFQTAARREAESRLVKETNNNLVEIEIPADTKTVNYTAWEYGQPVQILHKGLNIHSVFTGIKVDKTVTLIFGTIRLELTKRIGGSRWQ